MQKLNFPLSSHRMRREGDIPRIFDPIRKKWLLLTPEEWVRQHLIHYLRDEKKCPVALMAIETSLQMNGMTRRSDVVIFDRAKTPLLLAECKAPLVKLSQSAFDQAARYNMTLKVPYLLVTNGLEHFCCHIDFENQSYSFLTDIPDFDEMLLRKA